MGHRDSIPPPGGHLGNHTAAKPTTEKTMNTKFTSPERPQLYGIVPGKSEAVSEDLDACDPHCLESLWPLLLQRGGVLPGDSEVSFAIQFSLNTALVCFFWDQKVILAAGLAWHAGELGEDLWRLLCTSIAKLHTAEAPPVPANLVWAAIAAPPPPLPATPERIFSAYQFMESLAPAIILWAHQQN
jgi:hypothetical protein